MTYRIPIKRNLIRTAAGICLLALCAGMSAAEIGAVTYDQAGLDAVPDEVIDVNVQTKPGGEFSDDILNADIKRLYATGYFADVVAETTEGADGKLDIVIKLTPKPRVSKVLYRGNKKFETDKLRGEVMIVTGGPLNDRDLQDSANALREFYRGEGYNDAKITPVVNTAADGAVEVVFDIQENLRLKVNSVSFTGNTVYSAWYLKRNIATSHSYLSWLLEMGLLNRKELKNDKIRLRDLYLNQGYLDFKVDKIDVVELPDDPEYVDVTFHLHEGAPYSIDKVYVTGNERFSGLEILERLKGLCGETYDNRKVDANTGAIDNMYYPLGYADFRCQIVQVPDVVKHTVDINYRLTEGIPYKIDEISITGNRVTKDYVIRRELPLQPGDPVDKNMIEIGKNRLMGLGYFEKVQTTTAPAGKGGDMKDINYNVKEKDTMQFKIGGGFSDTDSLVGMVSLQETNFDITDPGSYFRGGGQRVRLQAMFGIERYDFVANFTEPWLFGIPLKLDLSGFFRTRYWEDWREQRGGGEISLTHRMFDQFTTGSVGYTIQNVRVYHMKSDMSERFQEEKGSTLVSKAWLGLTRDTRDSMFNPSSGYEVSGLAELNTQALGASDNYYKLEAKGIHYFSFLEKAVILHVAGKIGVMDNFTGSDPVPIFERYFLGGGDTLRGFPYRGVGPVDVNKDNYGGQSMLLFTVEATHPIWDCIRGAVFCDIGNAWEDPGDFDLSGINIGAGYGLRVNIPQIKHPLRIDLGYPVLNNQRGVDSKLRVHFNVGFTW